MTTSHIPTDLKATISTIDLASRLADSDLAVVDVRSLAAYNGWRLRGEPRGGHIPGAVAFPNAWLKQVDQNEHGDLLISKGITPDKTIVLYGDTPDHATALNVRLLELGYPNVITLEQGWPGWAADETLPSDRLPNYQQLVYPEWVRQLIAGEEPDTYAGNGFTILHVNFGVPEEYEEGHLPGAVYLDTNWLEDASKDWDRRSPDELNRTLRALGITHDRTVVLYGRDTVGHPEEKWPGRRAGQIAATRAASILIYAGVKDVRLLDGGYDWWVTAGYPLEVQRHEPSPVTDFGVQIPQRPDVIVDIAEAKAILSDPDGAALVSVRSWREHIGQVSGYNYIEPRGRIAGDIWGNCGSDAYHMQHYRNVDNTMRPYPEIASNWEEAGITPDKWVAFYCGTGWRASETWFYAHLMGWTRIAVYDGGWFDWSKDSINNPIEVGEPQDEFAA